MSINQLEGDAEWQENSSESDKRYAALKQEALSKFNILSLHLKARDKTIEQYKNQVSDLQLKNEQLVQHRLLSSGPNISAQSRLAYPLFHSNAGHISAFAGPSSINEIQNSNQMQEMKNEIATLKKQRKYLAKQLEKLIQQSPDSNSDFSIPKEEATNGGDVTKRVDALINRVEKSLALRKFEKTMRIKK